MSNTGQLSIHGKHNEMLQNQQNIQSVIEGIMRKKCGEDDENHQKFGKGDISQKSAFERDESLFVPDWAQNLLGRLHPCKIHRNQSSSPTLLLGGF